MILCHLDHGDFFYILLVWLKLLPKQINPGTDLAVVLVLALVKILQLCAFRLFWYNGYDLTNWLSNWGKAQRCVLCLHLTRETCIPLFACSLPCVIGWSDQIIVGWLLIFDKFLKCYFDFWKTFENTTKTPYCIPMSFLVLRQS